MQVGQDIVTSAIVQIKTFFKLLAKKFGKKKSFPIFDTNCQ